MSRPPRTEPTIRQEIYFPASLHHRLEILLASPAEGRVPYGAWSLFVVTLTQQALDRAAVESRVVSKLLSLTGEL